MNCNFAEKVSMLIDGELSETESEKIRTHVAGCPECQNLEKDFLFFREQIRASAADFKMEQLEIPNFPTERNVSFWKKGISLPAPVFAAFVLVLIGLCAWAITSRFGQTKEIVTENPAKNSPEKTKNPPSDISLARYDNGGRAEIYVAPRRKN